MKSTYSFGNYNIGIHVMNGLPYFCASDIAHACGYKSSLPVKSIDKPEKIGIYNYISLYKLAQVLGRTSGKRREKAQEIIDGIEREFISILPTPVSSAVAAPSENIFELRIKRKQMEAEYLKRKSELAHQQAQIFEAQAAMASNEMKVFELERELDCLRVSNLVELPQTVASHG